MKRHFTETKIMGICDITQMHQSEQLHSGDFPCERIATSSSVTMAVASFVLPEALPG